MSKSFIIDSFLPMAMQKNLIPSMSKVASAPIDLTYNTVDSNILSLIAGMSKRGLFAQADALENKYLVLKKAQSELNSQFSKMLQMAHPDGNTKVSDSGEFHTLESTQEHMLAALKTKSSVAAELVGMVKSALIKEGQDTIFGKDPSGEADKKSGGNDEGLIPTGEQQEKVKKIQSLIDAFEQRISGLVSQNNNIINSLYSSIANVDFEDAIANGSSIGRLYCQTNGIDISKASWDLNNKVSYAGKGAVGDFQNLSYNIQSELNSKGGPGDYVSVPPEYKKLLSGIRVDNNLLEKYQDAGYKFTINPKSLFILKEDQNGLGWISPSADIMANYIISKYQKIYAAYINSEYINNFISQIQSSLEKMILSSDEFKVRAIPGIVLSDLNNISKSFYSKYTNLLTNFENTLKGMFAKERSSIVGIYDKINNDIKNTYDNIDKIKVFPGTDLESEIDPQEFVGDLGETRDEWINYSNSLPKGTQRNNARNIANNIGQLISTLNESSTLAEFNSKYGSPFKTIDDLRVYINSILDGAQKIPEQFRKNQSFKIESLTKQADYNSNVGAGGSSGKSTQPSKALPPLSGGSAPQRNPQVQAMQFALQQYAATLIGFKRTDATDTNVAKMISVGPKNSPDANAMDGVWGSQTSQALEAANIYIQNKPLIVNPTNINADAKKNTDILVAANNYVKEHGKESTTGPKNIELDRITLTVGGLGTDIAFGPGDKVLHANDLASLKSLYTFLTSQGLLYPAVTSDGDRGFSVSDWNQILIGLYRRSDEKLTKPASDAQYNAAVNYQRLVVGLDRNFRGFMLSKYKTSPPYKGYENFVISESSLENIRGGSQIRPGAGQGGTSEYNQESGGKGNKRRGKNRGYVGSGSNNLEGTTYDSEIGGSGEGDSFGSDVATLPFTRTINFNNPWWTDSDITDQSPNPYLSLKNFQGTKATVMAQMLFSGDSEESTQDTQTKYIQANRQYVKFDDAHGWDGETYWVFPAGSNSSIPLNQYQPFVKNMGLFQNRNILDKYTNYLHSLKQGLAAAYQNWVKEEPSETAMDQVQHYHQLWLDAINKHLNQIYTTMRGYSNR